MRTVADRSAGVEQSFAQARPRVGRDALARAIDETAVRYPACRCALSDAMSADELVALGAGCTADRGFVCDRLAAVRRRVRL
ncbi:MAG TPA: hypothetical protein VFZ00_01515 [Solirubrobacter sp.]|nr:hypothetical protein [Solirubrobacter sp.]